MYTDKDFNKIRNNELIRYNDYIHTISDGKHENKYASRVVDSAYHSKMSTC